MEVLSLCQFYIIGKLMVNAVLECVKWLFI